MVCKKCIKGKHCGKPGEITPSCTCQHHPKGTRQIKK